MMEPKEWKNGPHTLKFEEPDLFRCYVSGPVTLDHAKETMRVIRNEILPHIDVLPIFICYLGDDGTFPAETRKYFGAVPDVLWKGILMIGGNPIARATANVLSRAMSLLSGKDNPMKMVKTLEEGAPFMEELRAKERSKKANQAQAANS